MISGRRSAIRDKMKTSGTSISLRHSKGKLTDVIFVFQRFFIGGIAHFARTDVEISTLRPYIPWLRIVVVISDEFLHGAANRYFPLSAVRAGDSLDPADPVTLVDSVVSLQASRFRKVSAPITYRALSHQNSDRTQ